MEGGKGRELGPLILPPRDRLCDLGLPSLGFSVLICERSELEQMAPTALPP